MIVVDSSVIVDFLRRHDKRRTWFYSLVNSGKRLSVSAITQAELYAGKSVWRDKRAREELGLIFSSLEIMPLSEKISVESGRIRAIHGVDLLDAIIAATTILEGESLATLNPKHFKVIPGLGLLPKT